MLRRRRPSIINPEASPAQGCLYNHSIGKETSLNLHRALKLLNPQSVIPKHIQIMFDTMTEGVVILDKKEQILLANKAFADNIGCTSKELQGTRLSKLKWESTSNRHFPYDLRQQRQRFIVSHHTVSCGLREVFFP
jgi:PAS domain-containing protein